MKIMMKIKNQKDFWAGIMFIAVGLFFVGFGTQYTMGTAAVMGPGYFPRALAVIVIMIGVVISAGSLSAKAIAEKVEPFNYPPLLLILGSVVSFGLLLKLLGLIISLLILITVSSYASHEFSWKATLINAAVLIVMCLMMFIWALGLRFPIWPSFIGN
jgi:hypothetical protein